MIGRIGWRRSAAAVMAAILALGFVAAAPSAASEGVIVRALAAPSLTDGFQRIAHPSGQAAGELIDFVFLPDSSGATSHNLLTLGRSSGSVTFVGEVGTRQIAQVQGLFTDGDFGLLSLTLAPDYLASGRLAVLGTYTSTTKRPNGQMVPMSRLDIYRVDDPVAPTSLSFVKTVIGGISQMDGISPTNSHGSGTVVWAPDGTFFAGFGDGSGYNVVDPTALRALDPDDVHGKILHIDEAGNGVPGNPYYGRAARGSTRERVFASGLRNPFRFSLDPNRTNVIYTADVGWLSFEKVTRLDAGAVGGWPCFEGVDGLGGLQTRGYQELAQCQGYYQTHQIYQPGSTTPKEVIPAPTPALLNVDRAGRSAAFVGGVFYQGDSYPADYRGAYFYGDYPPAAPSKLYTLRTNGTSLTRAPEPSGFGSSIGGPVAFRSGPGGDIYYADLNTGTIWQLKYAPGNRPPEVHVTTTTDPLTGTVCFDASESTDPDDDPYTVVTDFGDRTTGAGSSACHAYQGDQFTATVTVTDTLGAAGMSSVVVAPRNYPPTLTKVSAPVDAHKFAVGDRIAFSLHVGDREDGPRPVTEQTVMVHCTYATDCHNHYESASVLTPDASGNVAFATAFEDHGQNTTQVFNFTVMDKQGVVTTWTYVASPNLRTVTVVSPVKVTIDGIESSSLQVTVGSNNSVTVPKSSEAFAFAKWSDGGSDNQSSFVMPNRDLTLTAIYTNAIDAYAAVLGTRAGPPLGPEVGVAGGRSRQFQNTTIYWSNATGAHEVRNGILAKYQELGGPGVVGFPTTDETLTPDGKGAYSRFTGGEIYWSAATGSRLVSGGILRRWAALGRERSQLGYPLSDPNDAGSGGLFSVFQNGYIVWRADTNGHAVINGIRWHYDDLGGSRGRLGFPVTDELYTGDGGGAYNFFTGGAVYWSAATGSFAMFGGILQKWIELGSERSRLGYPITDELDAGADGWYNAFEHGYLVWRADTGPHMVVNGIRAYYDGSGGSRGFLGFPVTDEIMASDGVGAYNLFTGGSVYWSPTTGVHEVHGGMYAKWAETGLELGPLGYPVSDEIDIAPGGRVSNFQGGRILWTPATGLHMVVNGINAAYWSLGGPAGFLGFPTSDEYVSDGGWRNDFQGGSIHYSSAGVVTVTRA